MREAVPAPDWTAKLAPRLMNFFTVSGVAATRVSPVSAGTAIFMGASSSAGKLKYEFEQEDHQDDQKDDHPLGHAQERFVRLVVILVLDDAAHFDCAFCGMMGHRLFLLDRESLEVSALYSKPRTNGNDGTPSRLYLSRMGEKSSRRQVVPDPAREPLLHHQPGGEIE